MTAYRAKGTTTNGKRALTFKKSESISGQPLRIPCGGCVGCRLEKSRQWAVRCMHEAQLYDQNAFITLTYAPENLPEHGTLVKRDLQLFWKKLRKRTGGNIRYYACGEYGDQEFRPHYHACVFNYRPTDGVLFKTTDFGHLYSSLVLDEIWSHGHTLFGDVTFKSAAYVARYVMKKMTGDRADERYQRFDQSTGEIIDLVPEFSTSSRRPGIGSKWLEIFKGDVYPFDEIIVNGHPTKPPAFYDKWLEKHYPEEHKEIKRHRQQQGEKYAHDNTPDRKRVKEIIKMKQLGQFDRSKTEEQI